MHSKIFRSSSFRLGLLYLVLFVVSVIALMTFVYFTTLQYVADESDETIRAEIQGLSDRYELTGVQGLTLLVAERTESRVSDSAIYLLLAPDGEPLVGNIAAWPTVEPDEDGWITFFLEDAEEQVHRARARQYDLTNGFRLLVGRDMWEMDRLGRSLLQIMLLGSLLSVVLGMVVSILLARSTTRRIDTINHASREIMQGDLAQRIPSDGSGDDFDELTGNLNHMLDRITDLMEDVRRVSDNIAHDLRTPLSRLRQRIEALLAHARTDQDADALGALINQVDEILATFSSVLKIARIETGTEQVLSEPVELNALIEDVIELYQPVAETMNSRIEFSGQSGATIQGDRNLLFQALANLVDNALKFAASAGPIQLRVEPSHRAGENAWRCVIDDHGIGVADEDKEKIFRRFYRAESHRNSPGTGLGLSLVEAVARLHGGRVRLENNNPGLRVILELESVAVSNSLELS